eukprot:GHUV01008483.1.p1 GENE.GHUV01008483.1~~GHUV01008483.1.p1  ORF type:complete len:187 (+),score=36.90 GHUV01008483.1:203-763(+)
MALAISVVARLFRSAAPAICISATRRLHATGHIWQKAEQPAQQTAQVGRLNHVAIAVPDLAKAAERYRSVLGAKVSEPQPVPEHGVTVVFVELPNTKIELLHPLGEKSPIQRFLERNPSGGIHHMCLEVGDVKKSLAALTPKGVRVLDPEPKIGAHGNPVVFLHPKDNDGVLMELEQVGSGSSTAS